MLYRYPCGFPSRSLYARHTYEHFTLDSVYVCILKKMTTAKINLSLSGWIIRFLCCESCFFLVCRFFTLSMCFAVASSTKKLQVEKTRSLIMARQYLIRGVSKHIYWCNLIPCEVYTKRRRRRKKQFALLTFMMILMRSQILPFNVISSRDSCVSGK